MDHRLAAFGAKRCVFGDAGFGAVFEAFSGEGFGETAFFCECAKMCFELFVEHRDKALTEVKKASRGGDGVVGVEPSVEFVLLSKDMHGTLVSDVVCISYLIELYGFDFLVFGVMN